MRDCDYLIVGAGFFGAVMARELCDAGKRCLLIEKRSHIGGNCFTDKSGGIVVHAYGPHFFHTNSKRVWEYVNRFAVFHPYIHRGCVHRDGRLYSFPINLKTLEQVWGISSPQAAREKLAQVRLPIAQPANLEEWALSHIGTELYELFIKGYTAKQWLKDPQLLPPSIIKRLPIRLTDDDRYYDDAFQGVPVGGYTPLFERLLEGIQIELGVDYLAQRTRLSALADKVIYTGPIDAYFDYSLGPLEYRTLRFDRQRIEQPFFQSNGMVNYPQVDVPFTRIVEHKHFDPLADCSHTIITREFPEAWTRSAEPFYPIEDRVNRDLYARYRALASNQPNIIFGGRLAEYRYYDMHHVIGAALGCAARELADQSHLPPRNVTIETT